MTYPLSLPLTALAHSKHLVNWIKQQQQQQHVAAQGAGSSGSSGAVGVVDVSDVPDLMRHIQGLLQEASAAGQLLEGERRGGKGLRAC